MTKNIALMDYLFPNPPKIWGAEDILKADQLEKSLKNWGWKFIYSGTIGAISSLILRKVSVINSTLIQITSLALIALGIALNYLAKNHLEGLSHKNRTEVALDELKKNLEEWPEAGYGNYSQANKALTANEVYNGIAKLAAVYYDPEKELQPRLRIWDASENQKLELLKIAHSKGILLHFGDYDRCVFEKFPEIIKFPGDLVYNSLFDDFEESFKTSVLFLSEHLPTDKIEIINQQLLALSFVFFSKDKEAVMKPLVYLEDSQTVLIRGNEHEIKDISWGIKKLAPLFKTIKVERCRLLRSHVEVSDSECLQWAKFLEKFNKDFPGKIAYVDNFKAKPDTWHYLGDPQRTHLLLR